jgi:hypothetical protein
MSDVIDTGLLRIKYVFNIKYPSNDEALRDIKRLCNAYDLKNNEVVAQREEIKDLRNMLQIDCESGCVRLHGHEKKHHTDCSYYPGSLSEIIAKQSVGITTRDAELAAQREEIQILKAIVHGATDVADENGGLREEIARLKEILQLLVDTQNGCPLPKYEEDWNRTMNEARAALEKTK